MNILARIRSLRSGVARRRAVACGVLASLAICADAAAQFAPIIDLPPDLPTVMPVAIGGYPPNVAPTAAATYLAPPAWSQTLAPNVRFVILSNLNSDGVLDRETGLVWTRQTVGETFNRELADRVCRTLVVGSRMGWRLPSASELQSLPEPGSAGSPVTGPSLPPGHPFLLSAAGGDVLRPHWADEISVGGNTFQRFVTMAGGVVGFQLIGQARLAGVICVRTAAAP
jgi:hypothetical protein